MGIHIFKSLKEETLKNYLISKYLKNPHLIKGRKYDFRLYVLITGFKPLRIYLNKEGLVRIASSKYTLNINSVDNKFVHLTNTAINTENADYVYPKNSDDSSANKWNLNTYKKYLKSNKINTTLIFEKIKDIVIKTIISGQRTMINTTNELNLNDRNMFNLFGFDILITDKLEPALLEVNTRPFMLIYDKMDKIIKTNLFVDTLNIVGITPFSHEKNFKSFDKDTYKSKINDIVENAFCELTRPRGDFELIFPLKNNIEKYKKFFFRKVTKENKMLWDKVLKDK
jgi:tubulin polyglutamylase TTLL4